jgi:ribosomal protein S27E
VSNCEQTAFCFFGILAFRFSVCLRPEGGDNMACRVARSSQDRSHFDPVSCSECGSTNLEVCHTSKTLGPHLCAICAQSVVECGGWKENQTQLVREAQPVA